MKEILTVVFWLAILIVFVVGLDVFTKIDKK